jgi:UDP-glucose 4-epimerase
MKILVTGGAGFIGSNLVDFLLKEENEVIVIDNESSDSNEQFFWNEKAQNYKYDICDYEKIFPLFNGIDVVFHLAAESRIQPCIINPEKAIETNIKGTFNVLEACRKNNVKRIIYSSTSSAYGLKNIPPLKEDMPKDCLNPYSVTKTCGEELCLMYNNLYGLETVVFRYFNVYGTRQPIKGQYAPVIGIFLRQKSHDEPLTIVGDGLQKRDFTHVEDIVMANYLASNLRNNRCVNNIINVGTGKNHSVLEIAKLISNNYIFIDARAGEAKETLADTSKIFDIFSWKPSNKLKDYIQSKVHN